VLPHDCVENIRKNGEQLDRASLAVRFGDVKAPRFTRTASALRHERYDLPNSAQSSRSRLEHLMDSFPASDRRLVGDGGQRGGAC
jgi:hypothetical protein